MSLRTREIYEAEELERLAPFASKAAHSRGRLWPEPDHPYRTAYQRDRDRIVHSRAFRRLEYKTQVFVAEGDHYRNRLTHTLEGAQIARTIARALRLNEDLAEAIALAHDLGHTPFGHAGERVLARKLARDGGFDHNRQTLRVVDLLEEKSVDHPGLNLTEETREGIVKHGTNWEHPLRLPTLGRQRSLEAEVANVADEIAYTNHDLDDALRHGLLGLDDLKGVPLIGAAIDRVRVEIPDAPDAIQASRAIVVLIDTLVGDLLHATVERLEMLRLPDVGAVRASEKSPIGFSPGIEQLKGQLKKFLYDNFYNHPRVVRRTTEAERVLAELFDALVQDPGLLPSTVRARFDQAGSARAIGDYVAGMTDRFAISEHGRLAADGHGSPVPERAAE